MKMEPKRIVERMPWLDFLSTLAVSRADTLDYMTQWHTDLWAHRRPIRRWRSENLTAIKRARWRSATLQLRIFLWKSVMAHVGDSLVPVICTADQLDAYLGACAAGTLASMLEQLQMDRASWLKLSGSDGDTAWEYAQTLGLPLVDMAHIELGSELKDLFPHMTGRRLHATPLLRAHGYLAVAIDAGTDQTMLSMLSFVTSEPVIPVVVTTHALVSKSGPKYDRDEDERVARQMGREPGQTDAQRLARADELAHKWPMIKIMSSTMAHAITQRASDLHIRPTAKDYELLFRIDGNMVRQRSIISEVAPLVINRVKVFADMDITEHRRAQDGRASFRLASGRSVDLRISIIPTVLGESVVIRLLDVEESLKTIDQIGLTPPDRTELDDQMSRSHGIFLTTGPTGCGKSTTLYAMLQELKRQPINILTVEDPVEYTLTGIRQMEVNPQIGVTFANTLRSFLRHDPDVIMVGEIRDRETASMAIESALTGHLVLSTLHTNTAATTVTRLLEMGVEAFLLRAALTGIMAQRLVRLTCEHCRVIEDASPHMRSSLGVGADEEFTIGSGCPRCQGTGVFRRCAVYELMRITPAIRDLIQPGVEADRIHDVARTEGMVSITEAAVRLAREGRISLAQAYRVRAD